jgi:hypothetical protein
MSITALYSVCCALLVARLQAVELHSGCASNYAIHALCLHVPVSALSRLLMQHPHTGLQTTSQAGKACLPELRICRLFLKAQSGTNDDTEVDEQRVAQLTVSHQLHHLIPFSSWGPTPDYAEDLRPYV